MTLWCHEGDAAASPPADEVDEQWRRTVRARVPRIDVGARGHSGISGIALRERTIGDLLLTDWICPPVEGVRRSSNVRRDGEALLLITALAGVQVMHTADGPVVLRPGTLVFLSTRTPGRLVVPQAMAMFVSPSSVSRATGYRALQRLADPCLVDCTVGRPGRQPSSRWY
ncbi:hypothetical protein [Streptomyces plumbiresistens]|uniref:Transcription regulator HTH AraC- type ligand binding domain-containing protein n=1 Tax=Streptomyces plumbiresistens TaxID=511811 RepID=A0ABP7TD18_9ACTN